VRGGVHAGGKALLFLLLVFLAVHLKERKRVFWGGEGGGGVEECMQVGKR